MPLDINDLLLRRQRTLTVRLIPPGETEPSNDPSQWITLAYSTDRYTTEVNAAFQEMVGAGEARAVELMNFVIEKLVVGWDLTEHGRPFPTTDAASRLGLFIVKQLAEAITEDMNPDAKKSRAPSNGGWSTPTSPPAPVPIGTHPSGPPAPPDSAGPSATASLGDPSRADGF